jgi:hypothetical protein
MTLAINDIAPDFEAETTEGKIRFHDWIGNNWTVGSLKKWPSRRLGLASVAQHWATLAGDIQTGIDPTRANQRTRGAKRAAASRFKLMAAAVR